MKLLNLIQIREIIKTHSQEKLSTSLAYKMMKFAKATDDESSFYNEKRRNIIEQYAQRDAEGNMVTNNYGVAIQEDKFIECQKAANELDNTDVAIPNIRFTIEELSELKFSVADMAVFDEIIDDGVA